VKRSAKARATRTKRFQATPDGVNDRQHLTEIIRSGTGCTAKAAKETMDALIGTITNSLKKNQKVQLVGFGTFTVTKHGQPVAKIVPVHEPDRRPQRGAAKSPDFYMAPDFDEPLEDFAEYM